MASESMPGGHQSAPMVGTTESTQSTIESLGSSIANFDLFSEPPPLAATMTSTLSPGTSSTCVTRRRIVAGVGALAVGIGEHRAAQRVVAVRVGAAHALVHELLEGEPGVPAHVHAGADEHDRDAGVLADGPVALGGHARVDEDLRHGVLRGGRLLALVRRPQVADVVLGVVVADELEGVGDRLDEVFLADGGHWSLSGRRNREGRAQWITRRQAKGRAVAIRGVISLTENFTIARARQIVREVHDLRGLVGRELLAPEGEELLGRDLRGGLRDHVGHDEPLVASRVLGDACAIGDRRMALHHALHLVGRDAVAEALDDVVLAAEEPEIAVLVVARVVAGQEPAAAPELRRLLGRFQ